MNYLEAKAFRIRGNFKFMLIFSKLKDIKTRNVSSPLEQSNPLTFIMTQNGYGILVYLKAFYLDHLVLVRVLIDIPVQMWRSISLLVTSSIDWSITKVIHPKILCLPPCASRFTCIHLPNYLFLGEENLNAGLNFLWAEERARREALKKSGVINEMPAQMPTVDGLLPLTG